mmetsp:Transcript_4203/g.13639  ORF Transcript_4203/g.13639 Transcript_4203/m.13639 type:complete len:283 (-) Transcript_4203:22-870(-)
MVQEDAGADVARADGVDAADLWHAQRGGAAAREEDERGTRAVGHGQHASRPGEDGGEELGGGGVGVAPLCQREELVEVELEDVEPARGEDPLDALEAVEQQQRVRAVRSREEEGADALVQLSRAGRRGAAERKRVVVLRRLVEGGEQRGELGLRYRSGGLDQLGRSALVGLVEQRRARPGRSAHASGERGQAGRFQLGVHKVAGAAAEELSHAGRRAAASRPAVERQGGALTLAAHVRVARRGTVHAAELDVAREGEHLLERWVRADAEHANRGVERHIYLH